MAILLRFSPSQCLLLDEPDAHLHGSLQKAIAHMLIDHAVENNIQIFVTSHAPDFIADMPIESLIWIDRSEKVGRPCSELGCILVDLGSLTKADAMRAYGVDKILFIESGLDRHVLSKLVEFFGRKNPFQDNTILCANLPSGKGDKEHLQAFQRLLRESFKLDVKVACIIDNDYEVLDPTSTSDAAPLILRLGRKEIENYLIAPAVIAAAAAAVAKKRQERTCVECRFPTIAEVQRKLSEILNDSTIRDTVKYQVLPKYRGQLDVSLDPATKEREGEKRFEENWRNFDWQMKTCPGKQVLSLLKRWCQDEFALTLTRDYLIMGIEQCSKDIRCPDDIKTLAEKLEVYFYGISTQRQKDLSS